MKLVIDSRPQVTVTATFTRNGVDTDKLVTLERRGDYVWMIGGPTGYESLPVTTRLVFEGPHAVDWMACFGTPGRWDRCVVPARQMARAMAEIGLPTPSQRSETGSEE